MLAQPDFYIIFTQFHIIFSSFSIYATKQGFVTHFNFGKVKYDFDFHIIIRKEKQTCVVVLNGRTLTNNVM